MPGVALKFVSVNTAKPLGARTLPFGMRNFIGSAPSSLRNQPPMSTAFGVGFHNSIESDCGGSVWVRISLITIAGRCVDGSSAPGEPPLLALGRQLAGRLGSPPDSARTSEKP